LPLYIVPPSAREMLRLRLCMTFNVTQKPPYRQTCTDAPPKTPLLTAGVKMA
jgi:hypothetical protein